MRLIPVPDEVYEWIKADLGRYRQVELGGVFGEVFHGKEEAYFIFSETNTPRPFKRWSVEVALEAQVKAAVERNAKAEKIDWHAVAADMKAHPEKKYTFSRIEGGQ
jgi:hypothetical protein